MQYQNLTLSKSQILNVEGALILMMMMNNMSFFLVFGSYVNVK